MLSQVRGALWGVSILALPGVAYAQVNDQAPQTESRNGPAAPNEISEIIVTAQKRSERAIDVPLSIANVSGDQLAKIGVIMVNDLVKVVPGFTYQPSNYGHPTLFIRGIGFFSNSVAITPAVSVYVDQIPVPFPPMTTGVALDPERVEVLKGPQGTLFGQNSTGGAVNFVAAKPTDDLLSGAHVEYTNFGKLSASGFVSGPLSPKLKARLAVATEQGGAWQKSVTRPGDKLGDRNFLNGRLIVDWTPSQAARLSFSASGWRDKSETQAAQYIRFSPVSQTYIEPVRTLYSTIPAAPSSTTAADWDADVDLHRDTKFYQFALRGEFDLSDSMTLSTASAFSNLNLYQPIDPDGTPINSPGLSTKASIRSLYQELRLAGDGADGALNWMVGANVAFDDTHETQTINSRNQSNSGVGPIRFDSSLQVNNVKFDTKAVFGSVDYTFANHLTLSGSLRYTDQLQKAEGGDCDAGDGKFAAALSLISTVPFAAGDCITLKSGNGTAPYQPVGGYLTRRLSEDNLSWRGNLSWKPNRDAHLYTNVTKGYKSGSFSALPVLFDTQYLPVTQESVLQYEAGFKINVLDRALQVSGAAFYADYHDKQLVAYVLTPFGNLPGLISVPKSRVVGAELNAVWQPARRLLINVGGTYVDTKVSSSVIVRDPFGVNIDIKGYGFPSTPKWQATAGIDYRFDNGSKIQPYAGVNIRYNSRTPRTFGGGAEFTSRSYALVDVRAGIETPDGKWRAELWGRNIFDKLYFVSITHISDSVARTTGDPATFGITISKQF